MAADAHLEEQPVPTGAASDWRLWCRLCANDDIQGNMNVFLKNDGDASSGDLSLATAIGKYFWVNISRGEDLPEMICCECLTLVTSLVNFSERITRVQKLYCILQSASSKEVPLNVQGLRSKFGLLEEASGTLTEVHYVDEKPKLGVQEGLLPEEPEPAFEELENPLTPKGVGKEQIVDQGEQEQSGSNDQADKDGVLIKLCNAYEISEHSSSSGEVMSRSHSAQMQEKVEKYAIYSDPDPDLDKSHKCTRCLRTYATARSLHRHMRQDHWKAESAGSDLLTCSECSKKFRTHCQLERHSQRHLCRIMSKPKQHACKSCDKKYASSASATQHAHYIHIDERPRPVICEQCGVGLHSMSALKEHVLKHTDYAPFECEVCKKCFKSANRLKHHMETHDPHKYICPECGMQLNSRPTLNRHRLVHTDQMQHKCDYCGREFKRAKALKNHLILHTGLKPYSCDFCDRTFANGSNCRTHKKKAHPEELAAQEASGGAKTYNRNIPKLEALKAFTKNKDNLSPVATKQSGCFAFGKKPKPPVKENVSSLVFKSDRSAPLQETPSETQPGLETHPEPSESAIHTIDNIYNDIMIEYR